MSSLFWRLLISILTSGAAVGVVVGLIFSIKKLNLANAKAWIANNAETWQTVKNLAYDAVIAAQQLFDTNGAKKDYVMNFLSEHSKLSREELEAALEEAVKLAKKEFGDAWDKLPVTPSVGFTPSV